MRQGFVKVFVVCMVVSLAPSFAAADWRDFIPQPVQNGAYLDTYTSYERDDNRTSAQSVRWEDTFVREKLSLFSNGYSYDPRFLRYRFSIAGVLRQEDYEATGLGDAGWQYGNGLEYNIRLFLLPEHPYNLTAYAARYEPLFKEQAASQHNAVETSRGVSARYRKKPYFLHVGYNEDNIDSGVTSSDTTRLSLDGEYFKRFTNGNEVSFNGAYNPSWFSGGEGLNGTSDEYLLGNLINLQRVSLLRRVSLTSNLTWNTFDQQSRQSSFNNDRLGLYELLSAYLPWNFRTDMSYRQQDNNGSIHETGGGPDQTLSDRARDVQLDVVHRLYQSLDTTYTFLRNERTSSAGDSTTLSNALALNYTKSIPHGRVLAGLSLARADTDSSGQAQVANEPHSGIAVPGSFVLTQQNVTPGSIIVFLKSPLPPFDVIRLEENVNYVVTATQNTFEINVITLPSQFVVPGSYDFLVSYTLEAGTFSLRTDSLGGNASVQLFDDLLTPYFSYLTVRSKVLSGTFPGIPVDSNTYTTGVLVHRGPVRARGEYQKMEWEISPYESWLAEVQYAQPLSVTMSLYATATYLNKHYGRGTQSGAIGAYTEKTEAASVSVQKQLLARDLFVSAGGSYSHLTGLIDSNAYTANTSLIWKIGKLDISFGTSVYGSDTSGPSTASTREDHQLVYFKLRRQLF